MRSGYWYEAKQFAEADGQVSKDIILGMNLDLVEETQRT